MKNINSRNQKRLRRHRRVRKKITGTPDCPRLCVFRSARYIYAQLIDDTTQQTLVAVSSVKIGATKADSKTGRKVAAAREVGKLIAEAAKEKGIQKARFDRGGYLYHGRVAALARGARENGLEF